ncbi:MAG: PQQ-binding-like beta-propeller repeat protein [Phycisphaerales bacterium]
MGRSKTPDDYFRTHWFGPIGHSTPAQEHVIIPRPTTSRSRASVLNIGITLLITLSAMTNPARAQQLGLEKVENPVYLADSSTAKDSLLQINDLLSRDNLDQAVRLVDQTITTYGDRLIESGEPHSDDLFIPVRDRMNRFVLDHPKLLSASRRMLTPSAQTMLSDGQWARVYSTRWFTKPGYVAGLHHAQVLIENAHFDEGLRSLEELKNHPDYSGDDERFTRLVSLAHRMIETSSHADDQPAALHVDGIVPEALATEFITPKPEIGQLQPISQPRLTGANWDPSSWIMPTANTNAIFTNDGITISCFDRYTLKPIWRLQTAQDRSELPFTQEARARIGRVIEDASTVTLVNNTLYLASGVARNGSRSGDDRLLKIDANTGEIQWGVEIQTLDPSLHEASIRGRVIVDEDTVIVGARTNNRKKRLVGFSIVGIDAATGKRRWVRALASAGALPFQQMGQLAHSPILHRGTIYWTDQIGLILAIESATGHVRWARTLPSPDVYARSNRPSFAVSTPVITDDGLFALTSDGSQIMQIDPDTGSILGSRLADPVGEALYLLAVGDSIACVSPSMMYFYPSAQFTTVNPRKSAYLGGSSGIRGRVIVWGNQLLVPTNNGLQMIDEDRPLVAVPLPLKHTGNILALNGQIVVVDEMNIASYLSWQTAQATLQARIQSDPSSAITLTQLAYRANKPIETIAAADQAMRIVQSVDQPQRTTLEAELFDVIEGMLNDANTPGASGTDTQPSSVLDVGQQRVMIDHLAELASTHRQVVAHRMALGTWNELHGTKKQAIAAYQDILDQPALSRAMWQGSGIAIRGGIAAARNIGDILEDAGYQPYESLSAIAESERSFLPESPSSASLELIALQYPFAKITPRLWLEMAQRANESHQTSEAIHAAKSGLDRASMLDRLGVAPDQPTIDALAEIAISGMIANNQAHEAQTLANSIGNEFEHLTLRINGQTITQDQIIEMGKLANHTPVLGNRFARTSPSLLIPGSPIKPAIRIDRSGVVMHSPQNGMINYIRVGRGAYESAWSRQSMVLVQPAIPWQDEQQTIVVWPIDSQPDSTGSIESIQTTTGDTTWIINTIREELAQDSTRLPDQLARLDGMFETPLVGTAPINQILVVADGRTVIVSDRIGRAMGIDQHSGNILWKHDLPANRIFDLDLTGSILGICGEMVIDQPNEQQAGAQVPIAASLNPRTGEVTQLVDQLGEYPRWVRADSHNNLILGTLTNIISLEPGSGNINWIYNDPLLEETQGAWIANNQLLVEDADNDLWSLNLDQSDPKAQRLELRQRLTNRSWVHVRSSLDEVLVASDRGFAGFDQSQQLIASDPISTNAGMIDVAWGLDQLVMVEQPDFNAYETHQHSTSKLYLMDHHTGMLLDEVALSVPSSIRRSPQSVTAITGGVIVGFYEVSVFVRTTDDQPSISKAISMRPMQIGDATR